MSCTIGNLSVSSLPRARTACCRGLEARSAVPHRLQSTACRASTTEAMKKGAKFEDAALGACLRFVVWDAMVAPLFRRANADDGMKDSRTRILRVNSVSKGHGCALMVGIVTRSLVCRWCSLRRLCLPYHDTQHPSRPLSRNCVAPYVPGWPVWLRRSW